jgi:hypothetical protein
VLLLQGQKCFECEDDHSPSSRAEVRNVWSCISTLTIHLNGLLWGFNFTLSESTKYTQKYKVQYAAFARTILKNEKTTVTAAVAAWELEKLEKGLDDMRDKGTS